MQSNGMEDLMTQGGLLLDDPRFNHHIGTTRRCLREGIEHRCLSTRRAVWRIQQDARAHVQRQHPDGDGSAQRLRIREISSAYLGTVG